MYNRRYPDGLSRPKWKMVSHCPIHHMSQQLSSHWCPDGFWKLFMSSSRVPVDSTTPDIYRTNQPTHQPINRMINYVSKWTYNCDK